MQHLLERLASIEPEFCERDEAGYYWIGKSENTFLIDPARTDFSQFATLQRCLQEAISAHGCRVVLENDSGFWHAALLQLKTIQAKDKEPAIALLTVYLRWLEAQGDAA